MVAPNLKRADVERRVLKTLDELLNDLGGGRALAAVGLDASIEKDLGLGSLERAELLSRLEGDLAVELPESALAEAETPADLVRTVLSAEAPLANIRPRGETPASKLPSSSIEADTLVDALRQRAEKEPRKAHIYLQGEGDKEEVIRYGELYRMACEVAGGLSTKGVDSGDRVALMLPTGKEFFAAFAGILLAGGVPVPLYPPFSLDKIKEYVGRQADILLNSQAEVLITLERGRAVGHVLRGRASTTRVVTTVEELRSSAGRPSTLTIAANAPALIQYTSGSTGRSEGSAAHSPKSPSQHSCDWRSARFETDRSGCELATALSRHGFDRMLAHTSAPRLSDHHHVALDLSFTTGTLVVGNPYAAGHPFRSSQLRLRALREKDSEGSAHRTRSVQLAGSSQRSRAGLRGDYRSVRAAVCTLRF